MGLSFTSNHQVSGVRANTLIIYAITTLRLRATGTFSFSFLLVTLLTLPFSFFFSTHFFLFFLFFFFSSFHLLFSLLCFLFSSSVLIIDTQVSRTEDTSRERPPTKAHLLITPRDYETLTKKLFKADWLRTHVQCIQRYDYWPRDKKNGNQIFLIAGE